MSEPKFRRQLRVRYTVTWEGDFPVFLNYAGREVVCRMIAWEGDDPFSVDLFGWYKKKDGTPGAASAKTSAFGSKGGWRDQPALVALMEQAWREWGRK